MRSKHFPELMRRGGMSVAFAAALGVPASLAAQDFSESITRSVRPLVQPPSAGIQPKPDIELAAALLAQPQLPIQEATFGLGYTHFQSGAKETVVPLQYGYTTSDRSWNFRAESGYGRKSLDGPDRQGFKDVKLLATHVLTHSQPLSSVAWQLLGTLGLGVPVHGELGSARYAQQGRLIGLAAEGDWAVVLAGIVGHFNNQVQGLGSTLKAVHAEVHYELASGGILISKFDRSYLRGAGGESTVTVEYDWPLLAGWHGIVFLNRGLTQGKRSTGGAFDVTYRF